MLLAIDIGNSNIVLSLLDGQDQVQQMLRLRTVPEKSASRYRREIEALVQQEQMDLSQVDGAVICSVVPPLVSVLSAVVRELTGIHPYLVTPTSDTGLTLAIEEPNTLGCDIIAADTAAAEDYPLPVVVFDMGTATTVTVVDADRRYIGGAILPGVKLGLRALFSGTAQLPNVPIQAPPRAICSATIEALQSGAVFGAAAMMDGLVDRFEAELGRPCTVVATGGLSGCIVPFCRRKIIHDEGLLLRGLGKIYRRNQRKA